MCIYNMPIQQMSVFTINFFSQIYFLMFQCNEHVEINNAFCVVWRARG